MTSARTGGRCTARWKRLADFPGEGVPPLGEACEVLGEDHVGTYPLPDLCRWSGGTWRDMGTGKAVMGGVVAWGKWSTGA